MAVSKTTVSFSQPIEQVWHVVADLKHVDWRSDLAKVVIVDKIHFVEYTKTGYATYFSITDWKPPYFWAFTMENENMCGIWEGKFSSVDGGTRLTCTETVTAKRWWMHPFVPRYLKRQQQLYLRDLQRELLK